MPHSLDSIDRRILRALQRDGRLQNVELARQVGLSASPCLRRVRRLESEGIIERYSAVLNASKVGVGLTVFARISLISQDADDRAIYGHPPEASPGGGGPHHGRRM